MLGPTWLGAYHWTHARVLVLHNREQIKGMPLILILHLNSSLQREAGLIVLRNLELLSERLPVRTPLSGTP